MKKTVALLSCTMAFSACLTSNVLITVRPDGTGTIEQTTLMRPAAIAEFDKLTTQEAADRMTADRIWAEIQTRAVDTHVGWGASNRRVTPVNTGDMIGAVVTYDFNDVTNVDVDLFPQLAGMQGFWGVSSPDRGASTKLRMSLEPIPDGLERLTIHFPIFRLDPSTEPPASWASGSPAEMAALKEVLKGTRITITVRTEAPLVRTNSPFREENRVTLLDADIGEALFSKQIQRLVTTPGSFDELLSWVADLPGVTLAHERDITLDFQNPSAQPPAGSAAPPASQAPPDTDIFLASLSGAGGTLAIGPPLNISNSQGYDNQPSFSPDGAQIFYASARGATAAPRDAAGVRQTPMPQTDIYRYNIASRNIWRITQTPESEFSPTIMPDGVHLSMVRVEADGMQRLCSVEPAGVPKREAAVILPNVKPVGYHAWIDAHRVALYMLGERGQPATLQIADIQTGRTQTVATNTGRSLQRTPSGSLSFVQREIASDGSVTAMVNELDAKSLESRPLVKPAAGVTDPYVAWLPDGTLLMAVRSTIYRWHAGDADWSVVAHLDAFGLHEVSRLAVSPKGDRLAIVAQK